MSNTPTQTRIVFTPTSSNGIKMTSAGKFFAENIVPKHLTAENIKGGILATRDANGNLVPWSPIQMFHIEGVTRPFIG